MVMEAIFGAIVKALSPYLDARASVYIIERCCPPTEPPAEGGGPRSPSPRSPPSSPTRSNPGDPELPHPLVAELAAAARADAPRTPNVPLGSVPRRTRAIQEARLLEARARLAADATRAAAEGLAESEADLAAATPTEVVGEAPPAGAADTIGIAPGDHWMPSLHMQDPIMEPPLIPMANPFRIRRSEIRDRRVPRLA